MRPATVALLCAGCFNPTFDSGEFSCTRPGDKCPDGYYCSVDLSCWKKDHGPTQLGTFAEVQTSLLTTGRRGPAAAALGRSLYAMGGLGITGAQSSIEAAPIQSGASLDVFAPSTGMLSTPRASTAGIGDGGAFYVVGGKNGPNFLSSIERATLGSDGAPGAFAPVVAALITGRSQHTVALVGQRLYVIGGLGDAGPLATVEQTDVLDGVHPFLSASPLTQPRQGHASVVIDGKFLYVIGGTGGAAPLDSVEVATIAGDGTLGAFSSVPGVTLKAARSGHAIVVLGRLLYVLGGQGRAGAGDTALDSVERTVIGNDGSLAPFQVVQDAALVHARLDFATVVIGSYIYLIGGDDLSGPYLKSIERASVK